jgi:hypothetical protein
MKPRFKWLTGDLDWQEYGGKWISQRFRKEGRDYWFVRELINLEEAGIPGDTYCCALHLVCPSSPDEDEIESARDSCGIEQEDWDAFEDEARVEVLSSYGLGAQVWTDNGNNYRKLFQACSGAATDVVQSWRATMDRPLNRIGSTTRDFLKGDVTAGMWKGEDTPDKKLMRKMQLGCDMPMLSEMERKASGIK